MKNIHGAGLPCLESGKNDVICVFKMREYFDGDYWEINIFYSNNFFNFNIYHSCQSDLIILATASQVSQVIAENTEV